MKQLQKVKIQVSNGKETKRESIGSIRPVADSIAEDLLLESKLLSSKESIAKVKGIKTIEFWKEVKTKETKKVEETK